MNSRGFRRKLHGLHRVYLQSVKYVLGSAHSVAIKVRQEDDSCQDRAAEVASSGHCQSVYKPCMSSHMFSEVSMTSQA